MPIVKRFAIYHRGTDNYAATDFFAMGDEIVFVEPQKARLFGTAKTAKHSLINNIKCVKRCIANNFAGFSNQRTKIDYNAQMKFLLELEIIRVDINFQINSVATSSLFEANKI